MSVLGFKVKNKNLGQGLCMHTVCMHMQTFAHNTSSFHIPSYKIFSIWYFYLLYQYITGIMVIQYWERLMKYWIIFPVLMFGTVITNFFTIYQYI
jgi:hypothetical protein